MRISDRRHHFCIKQSFDNDSHDQQRFEIKRALSIILGLNWDDLKHIELKPNIPVCL